MGLETTRSELITNSEISGGAGIELNLRNADKLCDAIERATGVKIPRDPFTLKQVLDELKIEFGMSQKQAASLANQTEEEQNRDLWSRDPEYLAEASRLIEEKMTTGNFPKLTDS